MSGIGATLRDLRDRAGLSMRQVAATQLISEPYLERIESGEATPTRTLIHHLTSIYASEIAAGSPETSERRRELLVLINRAEARILDFREVVGTALLASGHPAPTNFTEKVTGPGGGQLAAHYALMVVQTARAVLTHHTAGSIEPHILGFAESIARDVLQEPRQETRP